MLWSDSWADQQRCLRALRQYGWHATAGRDFAAQVSGWATHELRRRIRLLTHACRLLTETVDDTARQAHTAAQQYIQAHPASDRPEARLTFTT
ncbi:hypothetical protein GCM10011574_67940 [Microbispora bryophytorum]|uniref:Uncharacterized protein n=1 Tax=Microbispora bryophytorum TaxID=1460882 RepID=A0A8H9LK16_9ACTN|nr:hypothetical protein GCM10011574_67940 [Microbispora bryophytorum]